MEDCSSCTPRSRGQFGQMACILMHALIGIDAHRRPPSPGGRRDGLQPFAHQILHQAFAQFELQHLRQPALRHIQNQKHAGDDAEHAQLHHEALKVAMRQRVIEGLVPAIEPDLAIGGGDDHQKDQLRPGETACCGPARPKGRGSSCPAGARSPVPRSSGIVVPRLVNKHGPTLPLWDAKRG